MICGRGVRLLPVMRVATDGAGGATLTVDEGATTVGAAWLAQELEPELGRLCCGPVHRCLHLNRLQIERLY
jgi:hypothetical protein